MRDQPGQSLIGGNLRPLTLALPVLALNRKSTRLVLYSDMFKISRLTDYGVVILRYLAEHHGDDALPMSARDIAALSGLPLPTVSKLLKLMAKHKLISAKRGALGGYELQEDPQLISLLRLIEVFEGPPAITTCMAEARHLCQIDSVCPQKSSWHLVHTRIAQVLHEINLAQLITPHRPIRV